MSCRMGCREIRCGTLCREVEARVVRSGCGKAGKRCSVERVVM